MPTNEIKVDLGSYVPFPPYSEEVIKFFAQNLGVSLSQHGSPLHKIAFSLLIELVVIEEQKLKRRKAPENKFLLKHAESTRPPCIQSSLQYSLIA